jgi:uncharacterized iron-regulated membrane protein
MRTIVFWSHLTAGVIAGVVILVMSVTGVLLTYERQLIAWSDRGYRSTAAAGETRLPLGALLTRLQTAHPDITPISVTLASAPDAPVTIAVRQRTLYVDAYSGAVLGEGSQSVRPFMTAARAWHRWLAVDGDGRRIARWFTGWANFIFLFILCSGFYLWFPRIWSWRHIRPVVLFNGALRGRARDFNWHNTIGAWSAVPLIVVVACALPMSFSWANAALYRVTGDEPPRAAGDAGPAQGRGRDEAPSAAIAPDILDAAWRRAAAQETGWKTITFRLPASARAPLAFGIDRGTGGQPQLRSTLTLARNGELVRYDTFSNQRPGARLRAITRFAHTGEILGMSGQTIAGLATTGASVLVVTGLSLAIRRFRGWRRRHADRRQQAAAA